MTMSAEMVLEPRECPATANQFTARMRSPAKRQTSPFHTCTPLNYSTFKGIIERRAEVTGAESWGVRMGKIALVGWASVLEIIFKREIIYHLTIVSNTSQLDKAINISFSRSVYHLGRVLSKI